ncbi:MAG: DUF6950 family protein [Alphaproteobacteria bacterium]
MRRADWAVRLAALLSAAEARGFDARHWNCASFALAAVEAVTGNKPGVKVLPSLKASADSAGCPRLAPAYARAGEIVLAGDQPRLGVVVEAGRAAFVGTHGLTTAAITECNTAWRIG